MGIKEMNEADLIAKARQVTDEANRLHREMVRRGITVDWNFGDGAGEIKFKYSRVSTEPL